MKCRWVVEWSRRDNPLALHFGRQKSFLSGYGDSQKLKIFLFLRVLVWITSTYCESFLAALEIVTNDETLKQELPEPVLFLFSVTGSKQILKTALALEKFCFHNFSVLCSKRTVKLQNIAKNFISPTIYQLQFVNCFCICSCRGLFLLLIQIVRHRVPVRIWKPALPRCLL